MYRITLVFWQFFARISCVTITHVDTTSPFGGYKLFEFVESLGYSLEAHKDLVTEDGYLLDVHRMTKGPQISEMRRRDVIFLMHGLTAGSDCWILLGNKSLAFLLAEEGYDVWLGNARGTAYSRKHLHLDPDTPDFWDFSWHEIGYHDVPTMINYVLNYTKVRNLIYGGHSQGGTTYAVMTSSRPEINKVIKLAVLMAPAVFFGIEGSTMSESTMSSTGERMELLRTKTKLYELGPWVRTYVCGKVLSSVEILCKMFTVLLIILSNTDLSQIDVPSAKLWMNTILNSISTRQLLHFGQLIMSAKFHQYNFGSAKNMKRYGATTPPAYDLSNSIASVAIFYGKSDLIVTPSNTRRLIRTLPNVVFHQMVPYEAFSHVDFIMARDVVPLLYSTIISLIANYTMETT